MTLALAALALVVLWRVIRSTPTRHHHVDAARLIQAIRRRQIGEWP